MRLTGNMTAFEHSISTILTQRKTKKNGNVFLQGTEEIVGRGKNSLWQTPPQSNGKRTQYYS
jgi:hypothetical protein